MCRSEYSEKRAPRPDWLALVRRMNYVSTEVDTGAGSVTCPPGAKGRSDNTTGMADAKLKG